MSRIQELESENKKLAEAYKIVCRDSAELILTIVRLRADLAFERGKNPVSRIVDEELQAIKDRQTKGDEPDYLAEAWAIHRKETLKLATNMHIDALCKEIRRINGDKV